MSNYINNLIARNQPAAEVVRPRLPSIFEPHVYAPNAFNALTPAGPLAAPQAANQEGNSRAPQIGQAVSNAFRAKPEPPAGQAASEAQITNASSPEIQVPVWRGIQQLPEGYERNDAGYVSPPRSTPSVVMSSKINEPPSETSQHGLAANRDMPLSPRPVRPQENETGLAERGGQAGLQADSPPPLPNSSNRRRAHERIAQQVIEESTHAASSVESSAHRLVMQPRVARRDENYTSREAYRAGQERPGWQSPPQMPTINVTIGRIEVKALPPAAAPPRPQKSAAPLMSLEEYMRRRHGGGDAS
ncbi:MAG: hypothetical protein V7641_1277 [Blastocatellia bacterium]